MNVIEFSCGICSSVFSELNGAMCDKCEKIVCKYCINKSKEENLCLDCNNGHDISNIRKIMNKIRFYLS